MGKTILIVFAHPEHGSFNGALMETARRSLEAQGHCVLLSDLYKIKFNPIISREDVVGPLVNENHFNYSEETGMAWEQGRVADDIKQEQAKVSAADFIIFQFPLHWMGMPAILKGWCDRVFLSNYAFTETELYDRGKFQGKKAMLSLTTGAPEHFFTTHGPNGDMNILLWPLQNGILRLIGFDVLSPQIAFGPQLQTQEQREKLLVNWEKRLESIFDEEALYFIPISKFKPVDPANPLKGLKLCEDIIKDVEEFSDCGLTIGQHLGRKIPPFSMTKPRATNGENTNSKY